MTERELLDRYINARAEMDRVNDLMEKADNELAFAEQELIISLQKTQSTRTRDHKGLGWAKIRKPTAQLPFGVPEECREIFHKYLKDLGYGEIIKPTIHPTTLKATIQELVENDKELPGYLYVEPQFKLTLYKEKKK